MYAFPIVVISGCTEGGVNSSHHHHSHIDPPYMVHKCWINNQIQDPPSGQYVPFVGCGDDDLTLVEEFVVGGRLPGQLDYLYSEGGEAKINLSDRFSASMFEVKSSLVGLSTFISWLLNETGFETLTFNNDSNVVRKSRLVRNFEVKGENRKHIKLKLKKKFITFYTTRFIKHYHSYILYHC